MASHFTEAWGVEGKMEGLFPYGPVACMRWSKEGIGFGDKPDHSRLLCREAKRNSVQWHPETQRFWPARPALANPHNQGTYGLSPAPLRIPPKRNTGCG